MYTSICTASVNYISDEHIYKHNLKKINTKRGCPPNLEDSEQKEEKSCCGPYRQRGKRRTI